MTTAAAATDQFSLTSEQVAEFHRDGFLGPLTLCSPAEMAEVRRELEQNVWPTPGLSHNPHQSRHLDRKVVWDLCSHPGITEPMAGIMGPDLILWRSHFFIKEPGDKAIPWHQDYNYWPLDPALNISAWIAIDEARRENSCVQLIPGSHRKILRHVPAGADKQFGEEADQRGYDPDKAVAMELQPGEFFLFNERTLHYSEPNTSNLRRAGLAVRVTIPIVKVHHNELFDKHRNVVLRGRDYMGFNQMTEPPTE